MGKNIPNKILILTNQPFPVGLAGTNRILSYCKGFIQHGYQPVVICIRPTEPYTAVLNEKTSGISEGIRYFYPGETTVRVKSFWGRRKNDLFAEYAAIKSLFKILKNGNVTFIIFYGNCVSVEMASIITSKFFRTSIYKEESEHPKIYFQKNSNFIQFLKKWFVINKLYKLYSGVLVMTHPLREYFLTKGILGSKILVVPHTVNIERFEKEPATSTLSFPRDYIAYLGPINQGKDGILTLVESFKEVSTKFPEMHLIIAGEGSEHEKKDLLSFINQLSLNKNVQYIGRIASGEISLLFQKARLLVSCRTYSFQNEYSFPSKVVEYLASGNPVVTTSPGDLAFYLKDRVNAFVAGKTEPSAVASKILEVLQDYDFAMVVARNAKKLVGDKFNYNTQTKLIIDFCNKSMSNK